MTAQAGRIGSRTSSHAGSAGRGYQSPALARAVAAVPALTLAVAALALAVGLVSLSRNDLDAYRLVVAGGLAASLAALLAYVKYEDGRWDAEVSLLLVVALVAFGGLARIPEYTYGYSINGIIHRSLFTALILIVVSLPAASTALYYVLGATPTARDQSRYPLILVPIGGALFLYGVILARLVQKGAPGLSWHIMTHAYDSRLVQASVVTHPGMRNHILGTFLLMGMTAAIALPVGVGSGVFINEYGGRARHVVAFATSMLRAISVFILAVSAFSLARYAEQNAPQGVFSDLVRGFYRDEAGFKHAARGSFLMASVFLSLLVIPVIARATEEGLRSVPRELREGSTALGSTEGHSLLHVLLPWTLPNVVTGMLLGLAEAAGSVTVLLFISGTGQYGLGPRHEATSLAYFIFDAGRGSKTFTDAMGQYQYSAALLLLCITLGLTSLALVLRQRFAARYRAGISYE